MVLSLTVYNGAVLAEVFRAGVNALPRGQAEAAYAIGMRKTQVMNLVLLPQAVKIMIPAIISQCVVALKDTSLILIVFPLGLTKILKQLPLSFHNLVPTTLVIAGALHRHQPGPHRARDLGAAALRGREGDARRSARVGEHAQPRGGVRRLTG